MHTYQILLSNSYLVVEKLYNDDLTDEIWQNEE